VASKLLEGRIALIIDGSPAVLTIPYLFIENFQSSEDYYMNFYYTSFTRIIRILGFILTIMIPAFYIAVVAYHHEMLPTNLFINIAMERQNAPLPAALECFIMLIVFDILKETGIRMPSNIGQALSIVGALVIGQAAVEAKLVAAPMIIVVASTGITSLLVPKLASPVIFVRFILLALASSLGFYGLILGIAWLIINLLNLRSFGVPELMISGNLQYQDIKDQVIRTSWKDMILRPKFITNNRQRMNNNEN
jgi:spore germination protein KA